MTDEGDGPAADEARDRPAAGEGSPDEDHAGPSADEEPAGPATDEGAAGAERGDVRPPEERGGAPSGPPDDVADADGPEDAGGGDRERSAVREVATGSADGPTDPETAAGSGESDAAPGPVEDGAGEDAGTADGDRAGEAAATEPAAADHDPGVPEDVRTYDRFSKIDGGTYERANEFLRERTYVTAREWAIARLCADFRTETGVEMTKIGEHLPELVPFMTDTYSPQAVNQARASFEEKVRKSGATFLYGAMSDFFTAEELDDVMYEATEVAKFLLEVEGVDLSVEAELEAEETVSEVMREVREHSAALRHDEVVCPACGHTVRPDGD